MGTDLKHKMVEYFKSTWQTIHDFAASHRASPQDMQKQVDNIMSEMTPMEEENLETGCELNTGDGIYHLNLSFELTIRVIREITQYQN